MTFLITGSAGHLGEALMRSLRAAGTPARGVDILPSPFTTDVGSIGDADFVRRCMEGVSAVFHAATLHKPHVDTHSRQAFVETNVAGTLTLLEAAAEAGVDAFVFTSTTSAFGSALTPAPGAPAAWITEDVVPVPRNIYGVTKVAAESLCELFHRDRTLPVVVLRTSRFFPEADDNPAIASAYPLANVQANELLYRRVDIEDVVSAHLLAARKARRDRLRPLHRLGHHAVRPGGAGGPAGGRAGGGAKALSRGGGALRRATAGGCSPVSTGSTSTTGPARRWAGRRSTTSVTCLSARRRARISGASWRGRSAPRDTTARRPEAGAPQSCGVPGRRSATCQSTPEGSYR